MPGGVKPPTRSLVGNDMSRPLLLLSIAAVALVAAGCRGRNESDPIPASLPGSYVYAATGSTFKKPWDFSARLELTPDKRFTLTLDKTLDGKRDPTETTAGTYTLDGDNVLIDLNEDQRNGSRHVHKLLMKSDSLIAEIGWTAEIFLKGVGAPNVVFVKQRRG
jgi:hypothetical protein